MEIQKNPITSDGQRTTPPVWSMNCLEQVCGICTMVINGKVRQSCSALIDNLDQPIKLEPMSSFRTFEIWWLTARRCSIT